MSQERRRDQRFSIDLAVEVVAGDNRFTANTKDISVSGCCIVSPYPLEEEKSVHCSLYVVLDGVEEADLSSLETAAVVQWAADTEQSGADDRHMAGLRFEGMTQQQRDWLASIIARGNPDSA